MSDIRSAKDLREAISVLEEKRSLQYELLKKQIEITKENLKPSNIFRNIFRDHFKSGKFPVDILISLTGAIAGFIFNKKTGAKHDNFLRRISGSILQWALSGIFSKITGKTFYTR